MITTFLKALLCLFLLQNSALASPAPSNSKFRGWDYLAEKLLADGIPRKTVHYIYSSDRMPIFTAIPFSVDPKEPASIYKQFTTERHIQYALDNLRKYKTAFANAEKEFGVDQYTLAALLLIETQFGKYTGNSLVVNRLSRLASIAAPENIKKNTSRLQSEDPAITFDQVAARAQYLEDTFYPEIPALIQVAERNKISVFAIKGSVAGAFGLPQFLPTAYMRFGVDADGDGRVSLFSPPDAISSAANFLRSYGWLPDIPTPERKKVLWNYNRSKPYVDAVVAVAQKLRALDSPAGVRNAP